MAVKFLAENHEYKSTDPSENIKWTSVTSVVGQFKKPFDSISIAEKCSKNKKSKWYNMPVDEILKKWNDEMHNGINLGSWYHDQRESDTLEFNTITREGKALEIHPPIIKDSIKYAPDQKLKDGIYPEHFVYLKSAAVCGQADRVEVVNGTVNVYDYKTNKEIKTESYCSWDGIYDMMLSPIDNVMDCNLMHYTLQLSLYMYIILRHNPKLKPGKLKIEHIIFDATKDEFGNRIITKDEFGDPIVKDIVVYELPYMKNEVLKMIKHLKKSK